MAGKFMKTNIYVQYEGKDTIIQDLERTVKEELKDLGIKQASLATLNIYFKPKENEVYYVGIDKAGEETVGKI